MHVSPFLDELDAEGFVVPSATGPVHARFGHLAVARRRSLATIGQLIAHASALCVLYGQASQTDPNPSSLLFLYGEHRTQQDALIRLLLDRARTLGTRTPPRVACYAYQPCGEHHSDLDSSAHLTRILEVHELGHFDFDYMARQARIDGDRMTHDLLVEQVVPNSA